jgi:cytochrome c oxidase cbb3-type subunit III
MQLTSEQSACFGSKTMNQARHRFCSGCVRVVRFRLHRWSPICAGFFAILLFGMGDSYAQKDSSSRLANAASTQAGKKIFDRNCAGCHGLDARGGEHAPNIANNPELQRIADAQLVRMVHDGAASGAMPAFGSILKDGEIKAVVGYLRSLQGRRGGGAAVGAAAAKLPGDPAAGKLLFFDTNGGKAGCAECHSVVVEGAGAGGFIAPDLTNYAAARGSAEILRAITHPGENANARSRTAVVMMHDGEKFSGLVRNQDNFSIQLQSPDGAFHLLDHASVASVTFDSKSMMPADYGERLTPVELNDLVSFLMRTATGDAAAKSRGERKHEDDGGD